jgi:vacuolar-type H+-ATPase subunit E/Vma4
MDLATREDIIRRTAGAVADHEAALRREAEKALVVSRREAQRKVLEARHQLLERVFSAVRTLLPAARTQPGYAAALGTDVRDVLDCLGQRGAVLRCAPDDATALRTLDTGRTDLKIEPDPAIDAGVLGLAADGSVVVDRSLASRLELMRPRLAIEVVRRLEEGG